MVAKLMPESQRKIMNKVRKEEEKRKRSRRTPPKLNRSHVVKCHPMPHFECQDTILKCKLRFSSKTLLRKTRKAFGGSLEMARSITPVASIWTMKNFQCR